MQVRKQQLELDMEQQTGSKQEKGKRAAFIRNISFNYAGKQVFCC